MYFELFAQIFRQREGKEIFIRIRQMDGRTATHYFPPTKSVTYSAIVKDSYQSLKKELTGGHKAAVRIFGGRTIKCYFNLWVSIKNLRNGIVLLGHLKSMA